LRARKQRGGIPQKGKKGPQPKKVIFADKTRSARKWKKPNPNWISAVEEKKREVVMSFRKGEMRYEKKCVDIRGTQAGGTEKRSHLQVVEKSTDPDPTNL